MFKMKEKTTREASQHLAEMKLDRGWTGVLAVALVIFIGVVGVLYFLLR